MKLKNKVKLKKQNVFVILLFFFQWKKIIQMKLQNQSNHQY